MKMSPVLTLTMFFLLTGADPALAAEAVHHSVHLDGSQLPLYLGIPFAGMLLSIALGPLMVPHFWEHHFGKVAIAWALTFIIPCWLMYGSSVTLFTIIETVVLEYMPFIILLLALFTVAGGIRLTGSVVGTPKVNLLLLTVGTVLASWMGTTGAAMLLIRPLLRANAHRRFKVHSVVFFIFLVANIGGSLTPLGDPPLFLGFLKGVSFFWTTTHLFPITLFMVICLLALYFIVDTVLYAKEGRPVPPDAGPSEPLGLEGKRNFILLAAVVGLVLVSGMWANGHKIAFQVYPNVTITLPNLMRDILLLVVVGISWAITPRETRRGNDFTWAPIMEVGKLFIGIFITMAPVIAMLRAGLQGPLQSLITLVATPEGHPVNHMYFWLTGGLSSFLDNAPTYLVFFNTAGGGHPVGLHSLMYTIPETLMAISAGAVFMGANSYIGNAPNFMVRSIAIEQGVKMPSFFGYMAWSVGILVPLFIAVTFIFFK